MRNRKVVRGAVALSVSLATVTALAGCGSSAEGGGGGDGGLEILTYWTAGAESEALSKMVDHYVAENPDVKKPTVAAIAGDGGENAQAALQSRLAGGNPPDTWQTSAGYGVSMYTDADLLQDLSPLYEKEGWAENLPADVIEASTVDGKIYGAVSNVHRSNTLWYNVPLIKKIGADPDSFQSLADVIDLAPKIEAEGASTLCMAGQNGYGGRVLYENLLFAALGPDDWPALFDGSIGWDDPRIVEATQLFVDSIPAWNKDNASLNWPDAVAPIGDGGCAFTVMGDWTYGQLLLNGFEYEKDFDYALFPGSKGTFFGNIDLFVVSKNAPNPENAEAWVRTVNDPEAQVDFSEIKGSVPVRSDADLSSLSPYQQETAKLFQTQKRGWSFQQGNMASADYVQQFTDQMTLLTNNHDVDAFISAMSAVAEQQGE